MSQTKGKCDYLLLSRSDIWTMCIPRVYCYYFWLEPTVRKDTCMTTTSVTVILFFFKSDILKVSWSQLCLKFLLNNYQAHWKQHFEKKPTVEYYPDMDQLTRYIFHQDFGKHETKTNESFWKRISCTKIQLCTSNNIAPK